MRSVAITVLSGLMFAFPGIHTSTHADGCGCDLGDSMQESTKTAPLYDMLDGNGVRSHDPSMAKEGHHYYMFCTGPGISMRISEDTKRWSMPLKIFEKPVSWSQSAIPGSKDFYWAPDISFFNHRWHLYYSVSTFGKNRSAIGLATNATLDPNSPHYKWVDEGSVFESHLTDNFNAIDPNIAFDEHGKPWMSLGSFWSGLKLVELDAKTGRPVHPNNPPISIAGRERPGAIEAPFIYRHGKYFYLFASFDFCCRGVNSTYNIRCGRSTSISGPYLDKDGKSMVDGGGTPVLSTRGRWHGPGGNSVMRDGHRDLLIYHSYDAQQNGAPMLRIDPIHWDQEGWPTIPEPVAAR